MRTIGTVIAAMLTAVLGFFPAAADTETTVIVRADRPGPVIDKDVYAQFSEHLGSGIYGGVFVGEDSPIPNTRGLRDDVIAALRELRVPMVRWPGGCFADEYHWRDGIGPRERRPVRVNTNWGGVPEDNAFGTHEFFDFVELIGADAYVNANVGTGTPREAAEWLEYMTGDQDTTLARERRANGREQPWKVSIYALGNETWGCGGNMRPEYYADLYNQYATFMKTRPGAMPELLASGDHDGQTVFTETLMKNVRGRMDAISLHYYTILGPRWEDKDTATGFDEEGWIRTLANTLRIDGFIARQDALMSELEKARPGGRPRAKTGLYVDEWGTWYRPEPGSNPGFLVQQNTLRDALVAAANFNIFHKYADRVRMTAIAQTVNVLQAMILTDGPAMVLTPTYHAFHMYRPFQDAVSLPVEVETGTYSHDRWSVPRITASAARAKDGSLVIGLVNLDPRAGAAVSVGIEGARVSAVTGEVLTAAAMDAHNTFENPEMLHPVPFTEAALEGGRLDVRLPAKSVVVLKLR
ncbi:MAG: alpha-N-arabinofuranosidase [Acidobacteria bacterium]|nr:alpha-N-arabinofuranosidase [Acidobacteriota bacterium]